MRPRLRALLYRLRRAERRRFRDLRRWLEQTRNLVHLSILLVMPLVLGVVTALANMVGSFSFLLFPPLASGAYTLFAEPESEYASPIRFVMGLTVGAVCGLLAVVVATRFLYPSTPGRIHAGGAALSIFFTGAVTWAVDVEEPSAFSTALLTLFVHTQIDRPELYVLSVCVGSAIVAGVFAGWRRFVYEQRARYLYGSTSSDDHVLVPIRGETCDATAMLGARIAAAHRAGKVVLLDVVDDEQTARAERSLLREHGDARLAGAPVTTGEQLDGEDQDPLDSLGGTDAISGTVTDLEEKANRIETQVGVPCEVVVAVDGDSAAGTVLQTVAETHSHRGATAAYSGTVTDLEETANLIETPVGDPCAVVAAVDGDSAAGTVLQTVEETNCDLVATAYETERGAMSPYIRDLFRSDMDVIAHRSTDDRTEWRRILVPVRGPSGVARNMVDFATRLAGQTGHVSVGTCIDSKNERRRAEERLAELVETFEGNIETRVAQERIEQFLAEHGQEYDLVLLGASQDRSAASRFISPPTFERIDSDAVGADVAIVDRG